MSETELTKLEEPEVMDLLLRRKVVSEAQIKAALDFQKSVGGSVVDVLFKLGLVRSTDIEAVLKDPEGSTEESRSDTRESNQVLDPEEIDVGELKLHHRLLDKVPRDVVEEHLVLLFFPVSNACSRKLIVGHGKPLTDDLLDKIKSRLGVEICALSLKEEDAKRFLAQYEERRGPRRAPVTEKKTSEAAEVTARMEGGAAAAPALSTAGGGSSADESLFLKALAGLLVKKGVISRDELAVEYELLLKK